MNSADPAGLGRGPLTRWIPVLWQASEQPPAAEPFTIPPSSTPKRFLLQVMFSAKRFTLPAALLFTACQIGESMVPVVMGVAIDRALATGDVTQLVIWLVVLALVFIMIATGLRFSQQLVAFAKQRVEHRLRSTLSAQVLHPNGTGGRRPQGDVVSLMTNDVSRTGIALGLGVFPIGEVAAIIFIGISLLVIYWPLGLIVLMGAPLVVWLMGAMSGQYARSSREYQALLARSVGRATDLVSGYRVIKGVRAETEATARYRQASRDALYGAVRNAGRLGQYLGGSGMVSGVFVAAVAALAGWFTIEGNMSIGDLIASAGLAQALIPQMSMVTGNAVPAWASSHASAGRVLDALRKNHGAAAPSERVEHADVVKPSANPVVKIAVPHHPTLVITPGELVGVDANDVIGSRLADALLDPHSDSHGVEVALDGIPAGHTDNATYRSRVVAAPHAATLFSGTVTDNLSRLPTTSPDLLDAALRAAACDDFADDERVVGEHGNQLSGGQRQRVALARALATDAPVLVLHDPTTAVDSVTEAQIAERLHELRQGKTTLLITSSPVLLGVCDRVVALHAHATESNHVAQEVNTQ